MAKFNVTRVIDRPLDEVFAYVSDLSNFSEWNEAFEECEKVTGGPIGVETIFRGSVRAMGLEGDNYLRLTAYEPGKRIDFDAAWFGPVNPKAEITFQPAGAGTRVSFDADPNPWGPFKLVSPAITIYAKRLWTKNLEALKSLLESRSAAERRA